MSWLRLRAFYGSFISTQVWRCFEALVSIFGQNLLWCGMFNLRVYGPLGAGTGFGPNACVLVISFLGTCLTDSFVISSFIKTNQPRFRICPGIKLDCIMTGDEADRDAAAKGGRGGEGGHRLRTGHQTGPLQNKGTVRPVAFFFRVMVSLFSNIALWNSAWVLPDLNIVDNTVGRSIVYIAFGTWLLYVSDAVYLGV